MTGISLTEAGDEDEATVIELSEYMLETVRKDGEFILYRGRHRNQTDASPPSILVVTPVSERPALGSLRRIENEYSLRPSLIRHGRFGPSLSPSTMDG